MLCLGRGRAPERSSWKPMLSAWRISRGLPAEFPGITKAYAIQAGRELRIIVESGSVTDADVVLLSRDVAKKIESELTYPGQIKVTVIREIRAVDYAK